MLYETGDHLNINNAENQGMDEFRIDPNGMDGSNLVKSGQRRKNFFYDN
jgi:hypothetical protein